MATDAATPTTTAVAGLFVAGVSLGAVYALGYTRLGRALLGAGDDPGSGPGAQDSTRVPDHAHTRPRTHAVRPQGKEDRDRDRDRGGEEAKRGAGTDASEATGKARRRKKGKGAGGGGGAGGDENGHGSRGGEGQGRGGGAPTVVVPLPRVVIPGDLEGISAEVGLSDASQDPAGMAGKQGPGAKTQKKKQKKTKEKQKEKQKEKEEQDEGRDEDNKEAGLETSKEADIEQTRIARSSDAALSGSSRAVSERCLDASAGLALSFHSLEVRPSSSFDTDSSWTHVGRRHLRTSKSLEGHARGLVDTMDLTSSDLASTASDSPVTERMDGVTMDVHGTRADLAQRTLAEKLVPKPRKTGVEDMLEQPDVPTLARVMRVRPPADESPVPGFSWEDYGDVIEDSTLVHDADEEDEGEWGVVKSRHRTRPLQTTSTPISTSHAPETSETMTKRQRQNARKRELAKAAKAETEAARLVGLAKHKRELERLRTIEQSQRGGGNQSSGGMRATVDDRGKLVWE